MNEVAKQHIQRVRMATSQRLSRKDLPRWIEENTYINGKNFSFKNHEFQIRILEEESPDIVVRKAAQTGVSELTMRMCLGLVMVMPGAFRIGYTFPTATFAEQYAKTRLDPIIQGSPTLKAAMSTSDIDNSSVKTFGMGKEIYFKGAAVGNAAISTTLDMVSHDELSFSSAEIIGDYHSRKLHSAYNWSISLSTPTFPGDLIDEAFKASRRHWNLCKCNHCNHKFIPDFYKHVSIPGWGKSLDEITKENLHLVRYQDTRLLCPSCGRSVSLLPEHREWVCENPTENHIAAGFQVQPFDAPMIVTLPSLIVASTKYATKSKFRQFSLGLPSADAENGLIDEDLEAIGVTLLQSPFTSHILGIDLGLVCHFAVGGVDQEGKLGVVHYEQVPLKNFRERYAALAAQYRISIKVADIQPYTDLIMQLSSEDPNLYGARYVTRQGLDLFDVKQREADVEHALADLREVSVNRNAIFDKLLAEIRAGNLWVRKTDKWGTFKTHLQDMKRASATLRNGEFTSTWQKSAKGNDHFHHALAYLYIAAQMRGIATGYHSGLNMGITKFQVVQRPPGRR